MNMCSLIKGMAIGVTVGAITYAVTSTSSKQKKRMKRTAGKALRALGSAIDGAYCLMK